MKNALLESDAMGEPPKAIQILFAGLALALAVSLFFVVRAYLPAASTTAHLALLALVAGSIAGFASIFTLALKVWQGGRVRVSAASKR